MCDPDVYGFLDPTLKPFGFYLQNVGVIHRYMGSGWSECTWRDTSDVTELGLLCSKKHCFNDLSVSPMYVAGQFSHDIWYTGPTTISFFNLSLGLTSSCLSVLLVSLKYMGTLYLLKSLLSSSETPLMYGITTGNFLFLWDKVCGGCKLIWSLSSFSWIMDVLSNGVFVGVEWLPWSMTQSGYPLICNAFLMWSFPFSNSALSLTTMVAQCSNVLATPHSCFNGWLLLKFKYWSVWVFFRNTLVLRDPSLLIMDH